MDDNARPSQGLTSSQCYEMLRRQIEHEDNLIGQRLSWLVGSQAFLFSAYAITLNGVQQVPQGRFTETRMFLIQAIPAVALTSAFFIFLGIIAGAIAMKLIRRAFRDHFNVAPLSCVPSIQGYKGPLLLGHAAPLCVPVVFLVVWVMILQRVMAS